MTSARRLRRWAAQRRGSGALAAGTLLCVALIAGGLLVSAGGLLTDRASAGESATTTPEPPRPGAGASLPRAGVVRFGEEFAGVTIGVSRQAAAAAWGTDYGVCRDCSNETWYFGYEAFAPEGAGVEFVEDRVQSLFTLWQPSGWRSGGGLELGTARIDIPDVYLELQRVECAGYQAYVHERGDTETVLYLHDDALWAFALSSRGHPVCR